MERRAEYTKEGRRGHRRIHACGDSTSTLSTRSCGASWVKETGSPCALAVGGCHWQVHSKSETLHEVSEPTRPLRCPIHDSLLIRPGCLCDFRKCCKHPEQNYSSFTTCVPGSIVIAKALLAASRRLNIYDCYGGKRGDSSLKSAENT